MSLLSLNSIGQRVFELESGNENVDGQMDVGHINLIAGLVKRNPPKNLLYMNYSHYCVLAFFLRNPVQQCMVDSLQGITCITAFPLNTLGMKKNKLEPK